MDILMAPVAYDQALAAARSHPLDPEGSLSAPRPVQIGETADVVDLERSCLGATVLAFLREEALDDLAANAAVDRRRAVAQDRVFLSCQRNAAEMTGSGFLPSPRSRVTVKAVWQRPRSFTSVRRRR